MTNILAIECSSAHASIALRAETPLSVSWVAERNHDAHLFPALQQALTSLGGDSLTLILVGAGPGSYGGVRVALAAAEGIALVRSSRVVALSSWLPLCAESGCSILSDAKRGEWTLRRASGEIEVLSTSAVRQLLDAGDDIRSVEREDTLQRAGLRGFAPEHVGLVPTAEALIDHWLSLSPTEQAEFSSVPAAPIYVRAPHITIPKRKPWEF